jgi:hypothetical protein
MVSYIFGYHNLSSQFQLFSNRRPACKGGGVLDEIRLTRNGCPFHKTIDVSHMPRAENINIRNGGDLGEGDDISLRLWYVLFDDSVVIELQEVR